VSPPAARLLACAALLALAPACGSLGGLLVNRLASTPEQQLTAADVAGFHTQAVAAQLSGVAVSADDHGAGVSMTVTAQETALLAGATLSVAAAAPCTAGVSAHGLTVGDQRRWDRPVGLKGTSTVTLIFSDAAALLGDPNAVVDLRWAGESCLRVPLGPAVGGPGLVPSSPWSVGLSARTVFAPGHGINQSLAGALRGGRWFSHGLLGVEAGAAFVACERPCTVLPQYQLPLWLLAGAIPVRVRGFGLGVEVAYGLIPGITRKDSDPAIVTHGPRLTLQLLETTPPLAAAARRDTTVRGVELSVSYQWTWLGPAPPTVLFGLGLVAF
jgi:hypothetical protein